MPSLKTAGITVGLMLLALYLIAKFAPASVKVDLGLPSNAA